MNTVKVKTRAVFSGQEGVSIIELLVAVAISMILAAGIFQVFVGSTTSYSFNEDLSRQQENARFAMHILRQEVQAAGYLGCLQDPGSLVNTLPASRDFAFDFDNAVYGLEAGDDSAWADNAGPVDPTQNGTANLDLTTPASGSDILVIRGINPGVTIEVTGFSPDGQLAMSPGLIGIFDKPGKVLLVGDCKAAAVFQATGYDNGSGTATYSGNLGHSFGAGAQVFEPRTVVFYVRNQAGNLSLCWKVGQENIEEIAEGVENMQVRYGVDTDNDRAADSYLAANAVTDWSNVVSVRVYLLVRSVDEILRGDIDATSYDVDGDGTTDYGPPNDRRMRMVFSSTMGLRNRLR
jgi:type IV pilus assembly protein PilW